MVITRTWDETDPSDTDPVSNGAQEIRHFKIDIRERLEAEHDWATTGTDPGMHMWASVTKTADYTATDIDHIILVDTSAGAVTIILPTAVSARGKPYKVIVIDATNTCTIAGDGAETVGGAATVALVHLYDVLEVESNNANWLVTHKTDQNLNLKGADVASANPLPLLNDGMMCDVTGTTGFATMNSIGVGRIKILQFDGILTLTHHATDLILPSGDNITTVVGDVLIFLEYASGDYILITSSRTTNVTTVVAGDYGQEINDTERTTSSGTYVKLKETIVRANGTLRVDFELKTANAAATAYGRVYRNGVAVGTEQSETSTSYVLYTEDIAGWSSGDLVQIYVHRTSIYDASVQNLRVLADVPFLASALKGY